MAVQVMTCAGPAPVPGWANFKSVKINRAFFLRLQNQRSVVHFAETK